MKPIATGRNASRRAWEGGGLALLAVALAQAHAGSSAALRLSPRQIERLSSGTYWALFGSAAGEPGRPDAPPTAAGASLASSVTLDPKIGPNTRLGDDPAWLPAGRRAQAEPHVARSVTDTNLVIATFQEGRYENGGAVNCGYALSTNGGLSWQRRAIPHLTAGTDGGPFGRASDPVAGVDLQNHVYLQVLGINGPAPSTGPTVLISKSTDGGWTFGPPLTVLSNTNPAIFLDKNWMAINTFPGTPTANRIVATHTRFDDSTPGNPINPIECLRSDDGGVTWSKPVTISPPICQGSQPVFLPDGALAVFYWNFVGLAGEQIEMALSPDGGTTFLPPQLVAPIVRYDDPVARSGSFLPSATADRQLGVLYVATQAEVNGPKILFTRSRDRGGTWTPLRAVNDTPGRRAVFNPAIAVSPDGQHVTIIFYDKRHDNGSGNLMDLYLAESFDGGETWLPNLRLTGVSSDLNKAPLTGSGRMVGDYQGIVPALNFGAPAVAVWVDTRTGSPDPFAATILRAQGSRFDPWRRLAFAAPDLSEPSVSGAAADPDRDGLPNEIEYGLGLNPLRADAAARHALVPTIGSDGRFEVSIRPSAVASDVQWDWIAGAGLGAWALVQPDAVEVQPGSTPDQVVRRTFFGATAGGSRFFRLSLP